MRACRANQRDNGEQAAASEEGNPANDVHQ
jgi:hypothetical protein